MSKNERSTVEMRDFPGLVLRVDPQDLPAGTSADQVNIRSQDIGRMDVRRGLREVKFEEE